MSNNNMSMNKAVVGIVNNNHPARFVVASGNTRGGNIGTTWDDKWSIFGGNGSSNSSSIGLGHDGNSGWLMSIEPGNSLKNLNFRGSSFNWYDSLSSPLMSVSSNGGLIANAIESKGSVRGKVLQGESLNVKEINAVTINAEHLNVSSLMNMMNIPSPSSLSDNISCASLSVCGNISGLTLNAGSSSLGDITSSSLRTNGNMSGLSLTSGSASLGIVAASSLRTSGNISCLNLNTCSVTASSIIVDGMLACQMLNVSGAMIGPMGSLNISGGATVSSLSLNNCAGGIDSIGNISGASLSLSGVNQMLNVSNLLFANSNKLGFFNHASSMDAVSQSSNIPSLNVSTATVEDCAVAINSILDLLKNYGLMK